MVPITHGLHTLHTKFVKIYARHTSSFSLYGNNVRYDNGDIAML